MRKLTLYSALHSFIKYTHHKDSLVISYYQEACLLALLDLKVGSQGKKGWEHLGYHLANGMLFFFVQNRDSQLRQEWTQAAHYNVHVN